MKQKELLKQAIKEKSFTEEAELFASGSAKTTIKAFRGKISSFSVAETSGVGARVVREGKMGMAYTERVDGENLASCLNQARSNAEYLPPDKGFALYEDAGEADHARFCSEDLDKVSLDQKKALALSLEEKARALDSRIINVPYSVYGDALSRRAVASSFGLLKTELSHSCYAYVSVMASKGELSTTGSSVLTALNFKDLDPDLMVRRAVEEAVAKLEARELDSGSYPVVLSEEAASSLLGFFIASGISPFFGENIQKGRSKLKGKLNQMTAGENITIVDEPHRFSLGAACFDSEGVDTSEKILIDRGRFTTVLHNVYSARREGLKSTGNGARGYSGPLSTTLFTPSLKGSDRSLSSLFEEAGEGVYITELEGVYSGSDGVSGDYSLGAKGFVLRGGEKGEALRNFTVAGNFYDLLHNIRAVADDTRFDSYKSFFSPSLLISSLDLSGR